MAYSGTNIIKKLWRHKGLIKKSIKILNLSYRSNIIQVVNYERKRESEKGGVCDPYREKRNAPGFVLGNLKEREFLEDLATDGRCMSNYIFSTWMEVEVRINPQMASALNMIIELRNPQNRGNFFTSRETISFSRGLCTTETIKSVNNQLKLHTGFSQQ